MISDYKKNDNDLILKFLSVLAFSFFLVDMSILILTPSESGYEPSIYGAYPLVFWISMGICISLSVINIILSATFDSKNWKYSFLSVFLCYAFLLFLPVIRGYEFFGQPNYDLFAHFSTISKIIDSGNLPPNLFYPVTHILATVLFYVGVPLRLIPSLISTIFYLIYISFLYLLGLFLFKKNPSSRFLLAFSLPLMFSYLHYAFYPFFFALSSIPLFLYCFHKRDSNYRISFIILTLILAIFIVFTHPLVTLFLLTFLISYQILFLAKRKNNFTISYLSNPAFFSGISNLIIIISISFLAWYLNFHSFLKMFSTVVDALFDKGQTTIVDSQVGLVQSSNASMLEISELLIKEYGHFIMYLLIASCCFVFILNKLRSKSVEELDTLYGFQFLMSVLFGLSMIFGYFIVFELIRAFSFAIIMSTIFIGIIFGKLYENANFKTRRKWINVFVVIIVCSSSIIGFFNVFESPWIKQASPDINMKMKNGLDWSLTAMNESIPLASDFTSLYKYELYHSQFNNNQSTNNLEYTILDNISIPSHFGYDTNNTLLASFGYNARYLIVYQYIINKYKYALKSQQFKYPIFLKSDFQKLNNDSTTNKLYMNGEFELWYIPMHKEDKNYKNYRK
jgi:hypothetical protein